MDARERDAERARLQRAAYGRDATAADRAALALFEQQVVGKPAVGPMPPAGDEPSEGASGDHPPTQAAARVAPRRFGLRALIGAALTGVVVGAVAALLIGGGASRSPFDGFTEAQQPVRESAYTAASLFLSDLEVASSLPLAGPLLLSSTDSWDVYGLLFTDADGGQQVCLGVVAASPTRGDLSAKTCGARGDFDRMGMRVGLSSPVSSAGSIEARWTPSGAVEIAEGS